MSNSEKFDGIKKRMIEENETHYGKEARALYGDEVVDASNAKLMGLTPQQYAHVQDLSSHLNEKLKLACQQGDPSSPLAQEVCTLHKEWLGYFWNTYSKEAHQGLAQMYVDDPRFKSYYDAIGDGCAEFLRDALTVFCR